MIDKKKTDLQNFNFLPFALLVFLIYREAKSKRWLRVSFFLDFRNFIFASSAARIKKYSQVINISIESYKFLFWHGKKFEIRIAIFLWKTDRKNSKILNLVCVNTQNFKKLNFVCLFSTDISQAWFRFFLVPKQKLIAFDWYINHL